MVEYAMTCEICNEAFIARNRAARYCPTCRVEQNRKRNKERYLTIYAGARKVAKPEKKKFPSLTEIAAKAKAAGMSYGEYVTAMERGGA